MIEKKKMITIMSVVLLCFPTFLFPINIETSSSLDKNTNVEEVSNPSSFFEEEELLKTTFLFEENQATYNVGEVFSLVFHANKEVTEGVLTLTQKAILVEEKLDSSITIQKTENRWDIHSEIPRQTFKVPLIFEEEGSYEASIGDSKIILEIKEKKELQEENELREVDHGDPVDLKEEKKTEESQKNILNSVQVTSEGLIQDVANWEEFIQAMSTKEITTINIMSDFETPNNPILNLTTLLTGNADNVSGMTSFVYLYQPKISRKVTIEGNNHQIDFRSVMLGFNNVTADTSSPWEIELKNLEIYHGNWYGPLSLVDLTAANQQLSSITYNNIINYGNQMLHAPYTDVYIKGDVISHQMQTYTSKFHTWKINATTQANFEVSNVTILEDATLNLKTIAAGNIDVLNSGTFTMKKNSKLVAEANGFAGEIEGLNIFLRNGNFILEENATVDLKTQELRGGIGLNTANSQLKIGRESKVNISSSGNKQSTNGVWWNLIWMNGGSSLNVEEGGELNIFATNMGSSLTNIIHVAGNAQVAIGKEATLNLKSDSTSGSQNLLYFASAGSTFKFSDAQTVNLERTGTIAGTSTNNGLINIAGSTGLLDIDVQSVKQWNRGNFETSPDYAWTPIFNLNLKYAGIVSTITSVSSITQEIMDDFKGHFSTQNVQRVLFEKIPDVELTLDALTEDPGKVNSYTITGKANPNSVIRFSGDPAIPKGSVVSPDIAENEKYHTVADENGSYLYELPEGDYFTGGNEVVAYAFLNGKYNSISTIVEKRVVNPSPVDPLDPETEIDPENRPIIPEYQGLLSLDFVSQFNFGKQQISAQDQIYYAQLQRLLNKDGEVSSEERRPNYVQISDRRSDDERTGWNLAVTQNSKFVNREGRELAGASLSFSNQELTTAGDGTKPELQETNSLTLIPGNKSLLLNAQENQGAGTWIYRFGNETNANKSISLNIPKGANPESTSYFTTLTWELSMVPEN